MRLWLMLGSQQKLHFPQQPRDVVMTSYSWPLARARRYLYRRRCLAGSGMLSRSLMTGRLGLWTTFPPWRKEIPWTPSAEPVETSSRMVCSPSPLTTKSTSWCERSSSGIAVGWNPPMTVLMPRAWAERAMSRPSLCSVEDMDIPTMSGLSSSRYLSRVLSAGLSSISRSIMLTSSTMSSMLAAMYSRPVGMMSKA